MSTEFERKTAPRRAGALPQTAAGKLLRSLLIDSRRMVAAGTRTISLLFMAFVTKSIAVYSDACSQN
jgi:hypothetical protein